MKFKSDEQRKAVMTKLASTRAGKVYRATPDPAKRPRELRIAIEPEEFLLGHGDELVAGDTLLQAGKWKHACYHYHQAAEVAIKGVSAKGYEDTHNIRRLLQGLPRAVDESLLKDGAKLTRYYYGAKPYGRERDLATGREIESRKVTYSQEVAEEARRIAVRIGAFCRDVRKAQKKSNQSR